MPYKRAWPPHLQPHLVETLSGFVVFAPQAVGAAKIKQHHGPGRGDRTGVALRGPLPSWGKKSVDPGEEAGSRARGQPNPPPQHLLRIKQSTTSWADK